MYSRINPGQEATHLDRSLAAQARWTLPGTILSRSYCTVCVCVRKTVEFKNFQSETCQKAEPLAAQKVRFTLRKNGSVIFFSLNIKYMKNNSWRGGRAGDFSATGRLYKKTFVGTQITYNLLLGSGLLFVTVLLYTVKLVSCGRFFSRLAGFFFKLRSFIFPTMSFLSSFYLCIAPIRGVQFSQTGWQPQKPQKQFDREKKTVFSTYPKDNTSRTNLPVLYLGLRKQPMKKFGLQLM